MNYKKLIVALSFLIGLFIVNPVHADEYPISELGNCRDRRECHLYCEIPQHKATCWSYSVYSPKSNVLAAEDEASASGQTKLSQLGITFPIAELGNCTDVAACKAYCTITQNQAACQTFAAAKGLTNQEKIIEKAATELGCTSKEECRSFCEAETNRDVCQAFAQKYHLKSIVKNKLVDAAQNELGCTSQETCRQLCSLPENQQKCAAFGKRLGVGNERREELVSEAKERLGCTSFEDCKAFCQDEANRDKCRNFGQAVSGKFKEAVQNKGNCTTAEECRKQCEENPSLCPNFPNLNRGKDASTSGQRTFELNRGTNPNASKPPLKSSTELRQQEVKDLMQKSPSKLPTPSPTTTNTVTQ